MRSVFLFAAILMAGLPACAQDQNAPEPYYPSVDEVQAKETLTVFGKPFEVTLIKLPEPSAFWEQVRPYLPADLGQAPEKPLTDDEILARLNEMVSAANDKYSALLDKAVAAYQNKNPGEDFEAAQLDLSADFLVGSGEKESPEAQKAAFEFLALYYLQDMLTKKIHPEYSQPSSAPQP